MTYDVYSYNNIFLPQNIHSQYFFCLKKIKSVNIKFEFIPSAVIQQSVQQFQKFHLK